VSGVLARVAAIATAVPEHRLTHVQARGFARRVFEGDYSAATIDRLLRAFDNTGIAERQLACPIGWYEQPRSFPEKNAMYRRVALELSERASAEALRRSGIAAAEIGAVVFVSTTGISTPSLDSFLIQMLDLPRSVARVPIWGLGCAGGAAGLARAAELVRALQRPVLLVAVEICSATFMYADRSKSNLIAAALFGDGAAAVVLAPEGNGPAILGGHSQLFDDTEDVMGWEVEPDGLKVRFARSIPDIVRRTLPAFRRDAARAFGLEISALHHLVVHPGGAKVLAAYEEALDVTRSRVATAWSVLREHGNMSSPTVLFVLERMWQKTPPEGLYGLALGLGPGFCAEGVVFRW
jgi:alkylresorcinol/alkylpyrone synthase